MYGFKDFVSANDPRMGDDEWLEYMRQKRKRSLDGVSTEENEPDLESEALDMAARQKLKRAMQKNKAKIKRGQEKAKRKKADKGTLEKRAKKQAINIVKKKLLQGKNPSDLSMAARQGIEKKLEKKKGVINKLAKRLVKKVKKDEAERMSKKGKSED